jgi:hypothetical protein
MTNKFLLEFVEFNIRQPLLHRMMHPPPPKRDCIKYFFNDFIIESVLSLRRRLVLTFLMPCWEENLIYFFSLTSMTKLLTLNILTKTLFSPPRDGGHWRISTNDREDKLEQKF